MNALGGEVVGSFTAFTPSASGEIFATAGVDDEIRIWDLHSGSVKVAWKVEGADIRALTFLADGRTLVAAGAYSYYICDYSDRSLEKIPSDAGMIRCLTPVGTGFLSGGDGLTLQRFDKGNDGKWRLINRWTTGHRRYIKSLWVFSGEEQVATSADDGQVEIHSLLSGKMVHSWKVCDDWVRYVIETPDHGFLLTLSDDGMLKKWSKDGTLVGQVSLLPSCPRYLQFQNEYFLCGSNTGDLILGRWDNLKTQYKMAAHGSAIMGVMAQGDLWLSIGQGAEMTLWRQSSRGDRLIKLFSQHW